MKAWKKVLILTATLCLYIAIGGVVFVYLEQGQSQAAQAKLLDSVQKFVANNSECGLDVNATKQLLQTIGQAQINAVLTVYGNPEGVLENIWSLQNAVVFCFTIVTTMGFGWITPQTAGGQTFCIFYAIIGIPLEGYMLSVIGGTFQVLWLKCSNLFERSVSSIKSKQWRGFLGVVAILVIMWAFLIIVPATIFVKTENWSFFNAMYFNFVAISTLGFGDITPKHSALPKEQQSILTEWLYTLGVMVYMFLSLAIISIVFVGVLRSQRKNMRRAVSSTRLLLMKHGLGKSSICKQDHCDGPSTIAENI